MSNYLKMVFVIVLMGIGINNIYGQTDTKEFTKSILSAQIRDIKSNIMNEDFELIIQLPYNYDKEAPKKYPTLYYCDGFYDAPIWSGIYGVQIYDKTITDCILVGFSYKGEKRDYEALRARDYTPTDNSHSGAYGNAEKFLQVIEKELIPFVENNYRADPKFRALGGCSLGGLFPLYVMLTKTDLFNSYIAISPAVQWDNSWLNKLEEYYHNSNDILPVSLFMSVGEKEGLNEPVKKFDEILRSRNYKDFRYKFRVLENTYHAGSKPEGYQRGLQFIFEPLIKK
jgi:predicted alpha/beta superfamily hydrolase